MGNRSCGTHERPAQVGRKNPLRRVCLEALEQRQLLAAGDPLINEFLASNDKGLLDQFGNHSDWIEIYNPGGAINLQGWHLTDDPLDLSKWTFPDTPLASNAYLVVFASTRDRTIPGQELHTNFKLDAGGEYLALVKPDLTIAHEYTPRYPQQVDDVSYGLGPGTMLTVPLIGTEHEGRYLIPTNPDLGSSWIAPSFDDSGWTSAPMGVGFQAATALPNELEPNDSTAAANIAAYNFQAYTGSLFQLTIKGSSGTNEDWFKLGALQAGDVLTVTSGGTGSLRTTWTDSSVVLYRGSTASPVALTPTVNNDGPGNDALIARYQVPADDTYYVMVPKLAFGKPNYELALWLENSGTEPTTNQNLVNESEGNDTAAAADDFSRSWKKVNYLSRTAGTISSAGDVDVFSYALKGGDRITVNIDSTSSLDARVSLLKSDGTTVALEDGTSIFPSPYDKDSAIYSYAIPSDGIYYVKVQSALGTGTYNADVYLSTVNPPATSGWQTYNNQIVTDIGPQMYGANASVYMRLPFDAQNADQISTLTLRVNYDDGFIAYLNGTRIAMRNAPAVPSYGSGATASHTAGGFEDIDITAYRSLLQPTGNVLAIQGLNQSASDSDFLMNVLLSSVSAVPGGEQYFATPTPRAVNQLGAQGLVADTKFSVDRGFFDGPFDVAISTDTPGAQIRYTTDGSAPTETTGIIYTGPIHITKTTTLRAIAYKAGWTSTDVDTQTYLFLDDILTQTGAGFPSVWGSTGADYAMDPNIVSQYASQIRDAMKGIPVVSLVMDANNWFGAGGVGIYPTGSSIEKPVSVEFFTADGLEQSQANGSVEITGGGIGGTSADRWKTYKLSMKLNFRSNLGPGEWQVPLFGEDATDEFDTLVLDAQINWSWLHPDATQRAGAKYIQDQYISDLQMANGAPAAHGRFVHLYLNGLYWGMYDLHERPDEHFAQEYFGGNEEDYEVIKHGIQYGIEAVVHSVMPDGSAYYYPDLLARVRQDMTNPDNYQAVADVLDIDDFIDYMILNYWAGNQDWAHKNWYASFNTKDPNGRWHFQSWDAEHTLRGLTEMYTGANNTGGPTEIHQRLKANPEYLMRFADRVHALMFNDGALTPEKAAAYYQARMNEVDAAIIGESARWGDNRRTPAYTQQDWRNTQNGLLTTYFPARTNYVLKGAGASSFVGLGWYPTLDAPEFDQHGGTFDSNIAVKITKNAAQAGDIYYTTDGSDPRLPGGLINPRANVYASPIDLGESTRIKARVFNGTTWSALLEAPFIIGPPPGLRVSEVMYNPGLPPPNSLYAAEEFEYIELLNTGVAWLDLSGFTIAGGVQFTFPQGTSLTGGQRILIVRNRAAFESRYGTGYNIAGTYTGLLGDGGDRLILKTNLGQVIQNFTYGGGWFNQVDGEGYSLVAIDPKASDAILNTKAGWRPSNAFNGGPGAADPGYNPGAVIVNEVLTHTDQAAGDWIELYNSTAADIDISGWFLSDSRVKLDKYRIPANTILPGHGYLVFKQFESFGVAGNPGVNEAFGLSELGDEVYLSSRDGTRVGGYRDDADFAAAEKEVTFGRYTKSTGGTDLVAMSVPTLGAANAAPLVGPIVINEIMYAPPAGQDEYIELRNLSNADVPLYDPLHPANTWRFTSGVTFAFASGDSIPAGGYALVVGINPTQFRTKYGIPAGVPIFGPYVGVLDNIGEKLELSRPGDVELDGTVPWIVAGRVRYEPGLPWPTGTVESGASLVRKLSRDYGNDPANWAASISGPTPGAANFDAIRPSATIATATPPVSSMSITFSEAVRNFDVDDLSLTRDGGPNLLTSAQSVTSDDGIRWTLNNLAGLTAAAGTYTLTLSAATSDLTDLADNFLAATATSSFTIAGSGLQITGSAGPDVFTIRVIGPNLVVSSTLDGIAQPDQSIPAASFISLDIDALGGDDQLVLGSISLPPGNEGIHFTGGSGADRITIIETNSNFGLTLGPDSLQLNGVDVSFDDAAVELGAGVSDLNSLSISGGKLSIAGTDSVLRVFSLDLSGTGTLDLGRNSMFVRALAQNRDAVLQQVNGWIVSGRSSSAMRWQGTGLSSSAAAAQPLTGLAAMINDNGSGQTILGSLGAMPLLVNDVIVKYTLNGDVNLDGRVNADDYFRVDSGFLTKPQPMSYRNGDLNYDGRIDADDYFLIDSAFLGQNGVLASSAPRAALFSTATPITLSATKKSSRQGVPALRSHKVRTPRHARLKA